MFLIFLISILTVILIILSVITNMIYSSLFRRTKRSVSSDIEALISKKLITEDYYSTLPLQNIKILSKDGITLNGYIIKKSNKNISWIILCHGISSNHATLLSHVDYFMSYGFNILLIDQRGHGQSDPAVTTYGVLEKQDISLWISYIRKAYGTETAVGLMGHSMGAAAALMTCSTEHKPNFIIAESPFSNLKKLVKYNISKKSIPYFPFGTLVDFICRIKHGFKLEDADVETAIKDSPIPILLIHGTEDRLIPYEMSFTLSKTNNLRLYSVEGAKHFIDCNIKNSAENYWNTIKAFLDNTAI